MGTYSPKWEVLKRPAKLWSEGEDNRVVCHLSPRQCNLRDGQYGFCGVRQNVGGKLVTLNYGCATQMTLESVETEAVFHYAPGAPILSLGNLGCNLNCDYCQNWQTSQAKFVEAGDVHYYTPEQVVEYAQAHGVSILSWTYNDPVVWHEFVLDTGRLAHERGMLNLYKSAFFISREGAAELCEVTDIFSVSLKTLDERLYRRISKGWLPPVLDATRLVFEQGKHVEISNLMVTDANDTVEEAKALADWVLTHLSDRVPLHFVRFHPDYKYTHVERTPIDRLQAAREAALAMGVKYCYLGNVYGSPATSTQCKNCGQTLITRYGLNTEALQLDNAGCCRLCGTPADVHGVEFSATPDTPVKIPEMEPGNVREFNVVWEDDVNACHLEITNGANSESHVFYFRLTDTGETRGPFVRRLVGQHHRITLSKAAEDETGVRLRIDRKQKLKLYRLYDRAHYPTADVALGEGGMLPVIQ